MLLGTDLFDGIINGPEESVCARVCVWVGVVLCECVSFIDCDHPQKRSCKHSVSYYKSRE